MIDYVFPLYRPPAEANSVIIQATYGCSHNGCTFCSMYKSKKYETRDIQELYREIDILAATHPDATKIFLADGDALSLNNEYLIQLLSYLNKAFVRLRRVSVYATAQNLLQKSEEELLQLQRHKLKLLYFGIETGNENLLKKINKGVNADQIIKALNKASNTDIKTSVTVILGLGGDEYTKEHIQDTAKLINQTRLTYLSTLQLGLDNDVKERFYKGFENFTMLNDAQVLQEQERLLSLLNPLNKIIFRSNHASNALHLSGTLPKDKNRLLQELKTALKMGESAFVPPSLRGF